MIKKISVVLTILLIFVVGCDKINVYEENISSNTQKPQKQDAISINNGKISDYDFNNLKVILKKRNFSFYMLNELKKDINYKKVVVTKVDESIRKKFEVDERAECKLDVLQSSTTAIIDNNGNLVQMRWVVGSKGHRGSGYSRAIVPKGTERGHVKSINEGAQDNCIEDSPINIIPQSPVVNDPNVKEFEFYRVNECKGCTVINDILKDGNVRVRVVGKDIDVKYNPLSKNEWEKEWYKTNKLWE